MTRRSMSKHSGAAMSSRLIPPNAGAIATTVLTISSGSCVSSTIGTASTPANVLKIAHFPSMTGSAASAPIFPSPSTAEPSEITATVRFFMVYMRASFGFFAITLETVATPGVYTSARSALFFIDVAGTTRIFPPNFLWSNNACHATFFFAIPPVYTSGMSDTITIKKPFDAHVHFRQGSMLKAVAPLTAANWSRAIVMPNTEPPVETVEQAVAYKKEILAAVSYASVLQKTAISFEPLMTFYLTKNAQSDEIEHGFSGKGGTKVYAVKSYPYGATTNSQWGYRSILEAKDVLKKMEEVGMPLLLHGEVHLNEAGEEEDPYDGERLFITDVLPRLLDAYPRLKVSLEHMSSASAVDFMEKNGKE